MHKNNSYDRYFYMNGSIIRDIWFDSNGNFSFEFWLYRGKPVPEKWMKDYGFYKCESEWTDDMKLLLKLTWG